MQVGTDWAGEYSQWTFDEAKQYIMMAKELKVPGTGAGVPLLDSELNEESEILLTLIRRLIHRTFGNGTEETGFQIIQSSSPTNNFTIVGGGGTAATAGYIFVDGWMPINVSNKEYTAQSGVVALTTPGAPRTDAVYIDVYYEEISPTADPDIVDPDVGFETSRRLALVWKVKVAEGTTTPTAYTDANNIPHWTLKLATLSRTASATITTAMITDCRRAALSLKRREYVHHQTPASTLWTVNHNLNFASLYLCVDVFDTSGTPIYPSLITKSDAYTLTIAFDGASVAGYALIKGPTTLP